MPIDAGRVSSEADCLSNLSLDDEAIEARAASLARARSDSHTLLKHDSE